MNNVPHNVIDDIFACIDDKRYEDIAVLAAKYGTGIFNLTKRLDHIKDIAHWDINPAGYAMFKQDLKALIAVEQVAGSDHAICLATTEKDGVMSNAGAYSSPDIIKYLHENKSFPVIPVGDSIIAQSIHYNKLDNLAMFLCLGAPFNIACGRADKYTDYETAIHLDNVDALQMMTEIAGINFAAKGMPPKDVTPLARAIANQSEKCFDYLLSINVPEENITADGRSAEMLIREALDSPNLGRAEGAREFLQKLSDVHKKRLQRLIKNACNVNVSDSSAVLIKTPVCRGKKIFGGPHGK